ncbi:hypothetical protein [Anatilimnocola floriformis]|uniref:hypothetical protein n=1 Tax=Anatilimnocola floriformis TaxID=2948575 RepID=UPI0020C595D9|nr:hypothetical protein [Anatilimnocola floriformis]
MAIGFGLRQLQPLQIDAFWFRGFPDFVYIVSGSVRFVLLPAAVGMVFGRPLLGLNVGFAIYFWYWAIGTCIIATYGGT